jgi:hypothetical protein
MNLLIDSGKAKGGDIHGSLIPVTCSCKLQKVVVKDREHFNADVQW